MGDSLQDKDILLNNFEKELLYDCVLHKINQMLKDMSESGFNYVDYTLLNSFVDVLDKVSE